ncbi:F0F1 ATP synthase subunit B [Lyngbya sp. CCY1209]|uniref:F0F1 ATP synthase subunit B n=1 Tax=Lyngbya sp. CCY1209 TaxID=2886103 RepID=UPI002D20C4F1|nr:F0F1 ATP synthase subunit B [Lyngbya sp. CCY1209]MEB3885324.1 F0F1 ATP synthase subunit B [Lyngbya sp. CCY1209]
MGNVVLLATEAGAEGGFGLNFNILETNLINLAIIIGLLVYYGRGFLGKVLSERRARIEEAITEAERRAQDAAKALAEQQEKLTQAQAEAGRIKAEAQERAQSLKERIAAQAAEDVERMKASANRDLEADRERAIAQLRALAVSKALERAEGQLRERLDEGAGHQIVDRSLALLGGGS